MTGIFLLFLLVVWVATCFWVAQKIGNLLPNRPWRAVLKIVIFASLFPMPVIDEIIAKPHFDALCNDKAVLVLDTTQTQGKIIWYEPVLRKAIRMGSLEAELQRLNAVEVGTGELVYHYHTVTVAGGWLVKKLKISETAAPLIIPGSCAPKELHKLDIWRDRLGIIQSSRPISNKGK